MAPDPGAWDNPPTSPTRPGARTWSRRQACCQLMVASGPAQTTIGPPKDDGPMGRVGAKRPFAVPWWPDDPRLRRLPPELRRHLAPITPITPIAMRTCFPTFESPNFSYDYFQDRGLKTPRVQRVPTEFLCLRGMSGIASRSFPPGPMSAEVSHAGLQSKVRPATHAG